MKKTCPFLEDPKAACYCQNIKSQNVKEMIYYCGGHFTECRIYNEAARVSGKITPG